MNKAVNPKLIMAVVASIAVFGAVFWLQSIKRSNQEGANYSTDDIGWITKSNVPQAETVSTDSVSTKPQTESVSPPDKKLLNVAFAAQAPFGDWSEPYENGCEEASIIMVKHYLVNQPLSKDQMKQEIDDAVNWQITNWGSHHDLDAAETLKLAHDYFGFTGQVIANPSIDQLKRLIIAGQPVIVPTAGRKLGNPNFRGAGPEYHMLVLVGYDDSEGIFITNDPGTRKGNKYIYKYDTIIHSVSGPKEDMVKEVVVLK